MDVDLFDEKHQNFFLVLELSLSAALAIFLYFLWKWKKSRLLKRVPSDESLISYGYINISTFNQSLALLTKNVEQVYKLYLLSHLKGEVVLSVLPELVGNPSNEAFKKMSWRQPAYRRPQDNHQFIQLKYGKGLFFFAPKKNITATGNAEYAHTILK